MKWIDPHKEATGLNDEIVRFNKQTQQALDLMAQGKHSLAITTAHQVCDDVRQHLGEDHPLFAVSLTNLAALYEKANDIAQAEAIYQRSLDVTCQVYGPNHEACINSHKRLAAFYEMTGQLAKAVPFMQEAVQIQQQTKGEQDPEFTENLNALAALLFKLGDYVATEPLIRKAVELRRLTLGPTHPHYAESLHNLGLLFQATGRGEAAESLMIEALEIRITALGELAPEVADSLESLADLYQTMQKIDTSSRLMHYRIEIARFIDGEESINFARCLNNLADLYYQIPNYITARPLYEQSLSILRANLPENHPRLADAMNNLANLYHQVREFSLAEPLFLQAIAIKTQEPNRVVMILRDMADMYRTMGNPSALEGVYRQILEIYRSTKGAAQPEVFQAYVDIAQLHENAGDLSKVETIWLEALNDARTDLDRHNVYYLACLDNLTQIYIKRENYAAAALVCQEALENRHDALGAEHPDYITTLNNMGHIYTKLAQYTTAEAMIEEALRKRRALYGDSAPSIAVPLENLGMLYTAMGKYHQAVPLLEDALKIVLETQTEKLSKVGQLRTALANLYRYMGRYTDAESLYRTALETARSIEDGSSINYTISLMNLAAFYTEMGKYNQAESLLTEAIKIGRIEHNKTPDILALILNAYGELNREIGENDVAEATFLEALEIGRDGFRSGYKDQVMIQNNLALLHMAQGQYRKAEMLLEDALKVLRFTIGEMHSHYAALLGNLAALYQNVGHYARAESLIKQALKINQTILSKDHPAVANNLNSLAEVYKGMGRWGEVGALHKEAVEIWESSFGEWHPRVAMGLLNAGAFYITNLGAFDVGEYLLKKAMVIFQLAYTERHLSVGIVQLYLATLYRYNKDYSTAESFCHKALDILRNTLGDTHPDVAAGLQEFALICAAAGRAEEALTATIEAFEINYQLVGTIFAMSSENQRDAHAQQLRQKLDIFLSLVVQAFSNSAAAVRAVFDAVLRIKSITIEALSLQRTALQSKRYPELEHAIHELATLRTLIARKTLAGSGSIDPESYRKELADLQNQRDKLENYLARQIPEMNIELRLREVDAAKVSHALPPGSVLVEFVQFSPFDFQNYRTWSPDHTEPRRYLAFVLSSGKPTSLTMIDLGDANEINSKIAEFRAAITGEADQSSREFDHAFTSTNRPTQTQGNTTDCHERKSDEEEMKESTHPNSLRHLRPTGASHTEFWNLGNALRIAVVEPWLETLDSQANIFLAPDGDLTRLPFEALPLADWRYLIDIYNIGYVSVGREILSFDGPTTRPSHPSVVIADPDFDLSGARQEGMEVARRLGVKPILETTATKGVLKKISSPHILHIASHGFFLPDQRPASPPDVFDTLYMLEIPGEGLRLAEARRAPVLDDPSIDEKEPIKRMSTLNNPLLRSGLVLTGGNSWLKGRTLLEEAEDAILTAEDVTGLDLTETELVVLSACDTGLGQVRRGEGIFGLRRAFILAGAKTLVMSLWKVPDKQTQELMVDFYERLRQGHSRIDALRQAKLTMKAEYPHPLYWGAFICQGEHKPFTLVYSQ